MHLSSKVDRTWLIHLNENMTTEIINFQRRFQMWSYTTSHSELLLRSPKTPRLPTRIDVFFKDVKAIHLPTAFDGLVISEAIESEILELHIQFGSPNLEGRKVFVVHDSQFRGYVIAGALAWHEDEREYHDPSYFSITSN